MKKGAYTKFAIAAARDCFSEGMLKFLYKSNCYEEEHIFVMFAIVNFYFKR